MMRRISTISTGLDNAAQYKSENCLVIKNISMTYLLPLLSQPYPGSLVINSVQSSGGAFRRAGNLGEVVAKSDIFLTGVRRKQNENFPWKYSAVNVERLDE